MRHLGYDTLSRLGWVPYPRIALLSDPRAAHGCLRSGPCQMAQVARIIYILANLEMVVVPSAKPS